MSPTLGASVEGIVTLKPTQATQERLSRADRCSLHQEVLEEDKASYRLLGELVHAMDDLEAQLADVVTRVGMVEISVQRMAAVGDQILSTVTDIRAVADGVKASVDSSAKIMAALRNRVG